MGKKNREKRAAKPKRPVIPFIERPFAGLEREAELVAMREILPLATMPVVTTSEYSSREVLLVTILPQMASAMRRHDGTLLVALQTLTSSGDASTDIAFRIREALGLEPGEFLTTSELPEPGTRLEDIVESYGEMEVYQEPSFWMDSDELEKPETREQLAQAAETVVPTREVEGVKGAYWCRMNREFVRWVRPEPREKVLDALARLRVAEKQNFEDSRFVGAFRAQGLSIPVWELPRGAEADEFSAPMKAFEKIFEEALASEAPLSPEEKRARSGIVSRQVTLR